MRRAEVLTCEWEWWGKEKKKQRWNEVKRKERRKVVDIEKIEREGWVLKASRRHQCLETPQCTKEGESIIGWAWGKERRGRKGAYLRAPRLTSFLPIHPLKWVPLITVVWSSVLNAEGFRAAVATRTQAPSLSLSLPLFPPLASLFFPLFLSLTHSLELASCLILPSIHTSFF